MDGDKTDASPVTWGELRKAIELAVSFCSELSVYTTLGLTDQPKLKDQENVVLNAGKALNSFMQTEIVTGMPSE